MPNDPSVGPARLLNTSDDIPIKLRSVIIASLEWMNRFALHILPSGFVRIRHYGMLSNALKPAALPAIREQLSPHTEKTIPEKQSIETPLPIELTCPCCKKGRMQHVMDFDYR